MTLNAQIKHLLDTIKYDLKQKRKFFVSLDGKNNLIGSLNIKMFGLQAGYIYNDRTSFYLGLYNTYGNSSEIVENPTAAQNKVDSNTVISTYGLGYINYGIDYEFHDSRKWRLSIPCAIGLGAGHYNKASLKRNYGATNPGVVPFELGINASYKLTWWLWFGGGLGTRISLLSTHEFNGPFYTFGFQIKTGTIIRRARESIREYREKH